MISEVGGKKRKEGKGKEQEGKRKVTRERERRDSLLNCK